MAQLTEEHISYIIKDLTYRGLVHEETLQEVLDHICSVVEAEMETGKRFFDAYQSALRAFGNTGGIRKLQHQIIHTETKARGMLRNYIMIALRNHLKNKFYTIINVTGLAVGIAACLIIVLYVLDELSYDRFHEKADRIYRVNTEIKVGAVYHNLALGSVALAEMFRQNYPEVESAVRLWNWGPRPVRSAESAESFNENVVWGDSTFFTVFTVPLLQGDAKTALTEANTVAINKTMADKYFPQGDALGKSLILDNNENYRVTAVYEDLPDNSHFHFDMIRSMAGLADAKKVSLIGGSELYLYLLLRKGTDPAALEAKFPAFVEKYVAPQLASALQNDFSMEKFEAEGNIWRYFLTPLTDIHLHSQLEGEFEANGNLSYVYLFSSIALFIFVIACINFMNLSTARSADRAREIGIRKVMGSLRSHLVRQFLMESFILSAMAFFLALIIASFFLPFFNQLAGKTLSLPFGEYSFYLVTAVAILLVGLVAGSYPSFFLSGFKPVNVLKGKVSLGTRSGLVRSGLVIFQFVISIFLIIATITIVRQLSYIQNTKIGFNKDQVLVVHQAQFLNNQVEAFRDEVLQNSAIPSGTISGFLPVAGTWRNSNTFWPEGKVPTGKDVADMISMQMWTVDYNYINTLGMTLKAGRNFSPDFPSDSAENVIVNEAAMEAFGLGDDPLNKTISVFWEMNPDGTPNVNKIRTWKIIGVVENFNFNSMREHIAPLAFFLGRSNGYVSFRFESAHTDDVLEAVSTAWKKMAPGHSFEYSFLDEDFGKMYGSEKRLATIVGIFAGLAIVIACLGLFALTAFTIRQRTKEISIRKTLGASLRSIVLLLSSSYGKLVLIAFVLAIPVAWYAMDWWLGQYVYRTTIGVPIYVTAGITVLVITIVTIGYQCVRAALVNPADSLRSE